MFIAAFVLAAGLIVLVMALYVLRQREETNIVEPFRFEDQYSDVPEIRVARARAMAIPGKHPALRTRNSRSSR